MNGTNANVYSLPMRALAIGLVILNVTALVLTWRKARGLSQDAAAEAFGVARKTWGRWETGERHPEAAVVERIKADG